MAIERQVEREVESLERTLRASVEHHDALLAMLKRKREALRRGDEQAMDQAVVMENEKLRAIGELEKQRLTALGTITQALDDEASEPITLRELAERLPEPTRGRLLVLREQLRERMQRVRDDASVVRAATEALMGHVQGIVRTIGAMSTGVSTYGADGGRPEQAGAISTINVTA